MLLRGLLVFGLLGLWLSARPVVALVATCFVLAAYLAGWAVTLPARLARRGRS